MIGAFTLGQMPFTSRVPLKDRGPCMRSSLSGDQVDPIQQIYYFILATHQMTLDKAFASLNLHTILF